jgi:hypothetical protein
MSRDVYDPPLLFAVVVYGCVKNADHIVYIEPELSGVPGGLIPCPFKDGVMELLHGIELTVAAGVNTGLGVVQSVQGSPAERP